MIFHFPGLVLDLRKPEISDIDILADWLASPDFIRHVDGPDLEDALAYRARVEEMLQENADESCSNKYLMAVHKSQGTPIGLAMICKIDWKNRHAEYAYVIGNQRYRGSLAAGDMNVTVYNYLFRELNLNKVYGYVFEDNIASLRINEFGGRLDGTLRKHLRRDGVRRDVRVFSITRQEFADFVQRNSKTVLRKHIARGLIKCP